LASSGELTISKSYERESDGVKVPKTFQGRRIVPLDEHLLSMLEKMRGGTGEPVAPVLSALKRGEDRVAMTFREHLHAAGVDRPRLEADNATEEGHWPARLRTRRSVTRSRRSSRNTR
jgi:hypothetical protein